MEKNKYYTPEPEELYIGYTCEAWSAFNDWRKFVIGGTIGIQTALDLISEHEIRSKYLDQFDIESLGWIYNEKYNNYSFGEFYKLSWWNISKMWSISYYHDCCYMGDIKSINELRTIMKFLNIK